MQTSATVQIQEDRKASERRLRAELKEQVNTSIIPVPIYLVPVLRCWLLLVCKLLPQPQSRRLLQSA